MRGQSRLTVSVRSALSLAGTELGDGAGTPGDLPGDPSVSLLPFGQVFVDQLIML